MEGADLRRECDREFMDEAKGVSERSGEAAMPMVFQNVAAKRRSTKIETAVDTLYRDARPAVGVDSRGTYAPTTATRDPRGDYARAGRQLHAPGRFELRPCGW